MKFPHSLTALACHGSGPTTNVWRPIALNKGRQRSMSSPAPAATTTSFLFSAASGRPKTGTLKYPWPFSPCSAASRRARAVLMVLIEI